MTIVIALNLPDGAVLGADSTVSLPDELTQAHTGFHYGKAEKVFAIRGLPVCIAHYGLGIWFNRSIGSLISSFESQPDFETFRTANMADRLERLRTYLSAQYDETIGQPASESGYDVDQLRGLKHMSTGFVVAGYSPGAFLPEVWHFKIPKGTDDDSAELRMGQGDFGRECWALCQPIHRLLNGYDDEVRPRMIESIETLRAPNPTVQWRKVYNPETVVTSGLRAFHLDADYRVMPLEDGVDFARFLLETTTDWYHFIRPPEGKASVRVEPPYRLAIVNHRERESSVMVLPHRREVSNGTV